MSKAVLISIQPKWCELIAKGKKTVEVRKSRPKIETPFKCYIYQSKGRDRLIEVMKDGDLNYGEIYHGKSVFIKTMGYRSGYKGLFGNEQKVIGEFICDDIIKFAIDPKYDNLTLISMSKQSCLSKSQLEDYCSDYWLYGWHISDLKIYDRPKELREFRKPEMPLGLRYEDDIIKKPPQSWCYVEEGEDNG